MERLTKRVHNKQALLDEKSYNYTYIKALLKAALNKLADYEDLEEQGRLLKLPPDDDKAKFRICVHTKATCHHKECKCSECPLTELFCDEFYEAIDRCYEDAYASGCLAGVELGKFEAKAKLKELRGGEND